MRVFPQDPGLSAASRRFSRQVSPRDHTLAAHPRVGVRSQRHRARGYARGMISTRLVPRGAVTSLALFAFATACAGGDGDAAETTSFTTTTMPPTTTTIGTDTGDDMVCVPGAQSTCACPNGGEGIQVCNDDGSGLGDCDCAGVSDSADSSTTDDEETTTGEPDLCGNATCDAGLKETCNSCPEDCGECVPCTLAGPCETALIPPAIDVHAMALDDVQMGYVDPDAARAKIVAMVDEARPGMRAVMAALDGPVANEHPMIAQMRDAFAANPEATAALLRQLAIAGVDDIAEYRTRNPEPRVSDDFVAEPAVQHGGDGDPCADPRLRIRAARIDVPEEDDDFLNDQIYCVIAAEGSQASELKLTPITPNLDEGDSHEFALAEGLVWGQQDLVAPFGNLALTYNCIESESPDTYNGLFNAIGMAADAAGGISEDNGWIFDTVGVVADLLPAAIGLDGDDLLFNASQVVPADMHLTLTSGQYWQVIRSGTNLNSDWEWHLRMEIWGCHTNGQ